MSARKGPDLRTISTSTWIRSLLRAAVIALLLSAATATAAVAQIYIVVEEDGTRRFTNAPTSRGDVFLETRYTSKPVPRAMVPFRRAIDDAAIRSGIDSRLIEAVIAAESAFDPRAISDKGAQGLMQLMPETAERFGVANVWDPRQNIEGGTAYLLWLTEEFDNDLTRVLAAYNAGEGAVAQYGGVPPYPETRQYVQRVLAYYRGLGGNAPAPGSETS